MPYSARGRTSRPLRVGPRMGSVGFGGMRFGPGGPSGGLFDSRLFQSHLNANAASGLFGQGMFGGGMLGGFGGMGLGPLQFGTNMLGLQGPLDWAQTLFRSPSRAASNIDKNVSSAGKSIGKLFRSPF